MDNAPQFAMMTEWAFKNLPAACQKDLFYEAQEYAPDHLAEDSNAATRWAGVYDAKVAYWRARQDALQPKPTQRIPRAGVITAAEVNDFLRRLPPLRQTERGE